MPNPAINIKDFSATRIRQLSITYKCSPRTLYRWLARGIDIEDPIAVAGVMLAPSSTSAIEPMIKILTTETTPQ